MCLSLSTQAQRQTEGDTIFISVELYEALLTKWEDSTLTSDNYLECVEELSKVERQVEYYERERRRAERLERWGKYRYFFFIPIRIEKKEKNN